MRQIPIALLALVGCPAAAPTGDDELEHRKAVLAALHDEVVTPGYAAVRDDAALLDEAATAFCAAPDEAGLLATRQAWDATQGAWKRMSIVAFGPSVDEPHRYEPLLDFWPVRDGVVDDLVAGDTDLSYATVSTLGASARGLPVVAYLLWHPDQTDASWFDERRCTYLTALTEDLHANASGLHDAWVDYAVQLADPAAHDLAYASHQQVVDEWVNRVLFAYDDIRSEKLGKPLGDASQGTPSPEAVESRFSKRSLQDAIDTWDGAEAVLGDREHGLVALMPLDRTPIGFFDDLDAARTAARTALGGIHEPLSEAVVDHRDGVVAAQDAIRTVQVLLQVDMTQALGVTLAFNDNDGD